MSRFRTALRDLVRWALNSNYGEDCSPSPAYPGSNSIKSLSNLNEYNHGFNFTVFNATGGKVIRVHTYDPKTDRHISNLYIITDKEDFGEELAQIITRDSLSR